MHKKNEIFIVLAARGICQNQKRVMSGETSFHSVAPGQHRIFAVMATVFIFMGLGIERKVLSLDDVFNYYVTRPLACISISRYSFDILITQNCKTNVFSILSHLQKTSGSWVQC